MINYYIQLQNFEKTVIKNPNYHMEKKKNTHTKKKKNTHTHKTVGHLGSPERALSIRYP